MMKQTPMTHGKRHSAMAGDPERRQWLADEAFCAYECLHGSGESEVRRT